MVLSNVGLQYNRIKKKISDTIRESGRNFAGIGVRFYEFPTTYVMFDYSEEANEAAIVD